jgi:outer membrane receptor for ferrienterochelin and colicins
MKFPLTRIATAIALLMAGSAALAGQLESKAGGAEGAAPEPATSAAGGKTVQRVEVKGDAQAYDPRRDDTASKTILSHEEIIKYGDTNVFDVLKRAPGVTVIGNSIRMRGLGNGYTQILVNGERPPPGFSMDNLTPEQIDRIEVIRAATAEHSMQAIAGTINIVLKKVVAQPQRDLRINAARFDEGSNVFMMGTLADRVDTLSYYLNAMLGHNESSSPGTSSDRFITPQGQVVQWRDIVSASRNRSTMAGVQPRLNWKLPDDGQLNVSAFVQAMHSTYGWRSLSTNRLGSFGSPDYVDRRNDSSNSGLFTGADVNWVAKLGGGKLDAKLSASRGRNDSDSMRPSATADHAIQLRRDADNRSSYTNFSTTGKFTRTLFDGHAMAAGWEASSNLTEDTAVRVEGLVGSAPVTTG